MENEGFERGGDGGGERKNTPGSAAAAATRAPPGSDRREGVKVKVSALRRGALDVPAGQRKLFSLCIKEKQAGWGGCGRGG